MMIDVMERVKASGELLSKVQCQGPRAKTTEVEVCMALVCASTDSGSTNLVPTVGRFR